MGDAHTLSAAAKYANQTGSTAHHDGDVDETAQRTAVAVELSCPHATVHTLAAGIPPSRLDLTLS